MSKNKENNDDPAHPADPYGPTELDPRRAFAMGAETPPSLPAHWSPPEAEVMDPLFPNYTIIELIGRGGMGAVYRGVQQSLDRTVAIKVLPPEMAEADPSFAVRFEREAKSMASLDHTNIVHVYDFGRTDAGHWFIVMEFVDGMDFHQLIRTGELDTTGALNAVSQICDALEYAHDQGYVHRDIKPANIFINQQGVLKVGDFGLAKLIEGDGPESDEEAQPMITQTGVSMGTPDYCAPEQIEGRAVDQRADIYSLGVMFYEMLTRELPRGNFPPPSKKVQLDVRIDDVVLRAMESAPEMRYSSAGEMKTEVDEVRTGTLAPEPAVASADDAKPASGFSTDKRVQNFRTLRRVLFWGGVTICLIGLANAFFHAVRNDSDSDGRGTSSGLAEAEVASLFPLSVPERPTTECRLVVLRTDIENQAELPGWIDVLAEQDPSEIVQFGNSTNSGKLAWLNSEGSIDGVGAKDQANEGWLAGLRGAGPGFRQLWFDGEWRVTAIHESGSVFSRGDPETPPNLGPCVAIVARGSLKRALRNDGTIVCWGSDLRDKEKELANWYDSLSEVTALHPNFLIRRGNELIHNPGPIKEARSWQDVSEEIGHGYFRYSDGRLDRITENSTSAWLMTAPYQSDVLEVAASKGVADSGCGFRMQDGKWRIFANKADPNSESEQLTECLSDATQLLFRDNLILALLPADTVPRSGHWEVDELIKARQHMREGSSNVGTESAAPLQNSPFPLALPEFPAKRPTKEHRLVVLSLEYEKFPSPPEWVTKLGEDDPLRIVQISTNDDLGHYSKKFRALQSDGSIWSSPGRLTADGRTLRVLGDLLLWSNGSFTSPSGPQLPPNLNQGFAEVSTSRYRIGIRHDGTAEVFGNPTDPYIQEFVTGLVDVVDITTGEAAGRGAALHRDGSLTVWTSSREGISSRQLPPRTALALCPRARFALSPQRTLLYLPQHAGIAQAVLDSLVEPLRWASGDSWGTGESGLATIAENGSIIIWHDSDALSPRRASPLLEEALFDASEIHGESGFLYALLPTDTVPRSGYWEVDELIAAREAMQKEPGN